MNKNCECKYRIKNPYSIDKNDMYICKYPTNKNVECDDFSKKYCKIYMKIRYMLMEEL